MAAFGLVPLILPILFIAFSVFLYKHRSTATPPPQKRQPPSPRKLPLIGNLHQLGLYPYRTLQSLSKRYGHLMLLHLGRNPVLVVSSADAAREVLKNQDLIFSNRPKLRILQKPLYEFKDVVLAPYGEHWRQARGACVLHLLSNKMVQSFRRVREEETSFMIERVVRDPWSPLSSVVNLSQVFEDVVLDVLCRVTVGRKYCSYGGEGSKSKKLVREFIELLGMWTFEDCGISWLGWTRRVSGLDARVKRLTTDFDELLETMVREHRDGMKREKVGDDHEYNKGDHDITDARLDFVDMLLEFQRENQDSSPFEDADVIKALILDILVAGTDTTSSTLEWTMAELIRNPKTMRRLQNEVRELIGSKEEVTEDDVLEMHYLKAVIKEGLRLRLPAPLLLPRVSTQHTKVLGYDLAAGTQVMINAWAIARDPLLWQNPEEFNPDRFLTNSIDFRGLQFEMIPFGAGRRGCPGIAFGTSVVELALAKLVHKFDFELPNGGRGEDM